MAGFEAPHQILPEDTCSDHDCFGQEISKGASSDMEKQRNCPGLILPWDNVDTRESRDSTGKGKIQHLKEKQRVKFAVLLLPMSH